LVLGPNETAHADGSPAWLRVAQVLAGGAQAQPLGLDSRESGLRPGVVVDRAPGRKRAVKLVSAKPSVTYALHGVAPRGRSQLPLGDGSRKTSRLAVR